jgi:hypothetical protein
MVQITKSKKKDNEWRVQNDEWGKVRKNKEEEENIGHLVLVVSSTTF